MPKAESASDAGPSRRAGAPTLTAPTVTRIPTAHDTRYQCAPGEVPFGAGFVAVGVGRDVCTGQGWRQEA